MFPDHTEIEEMVKKEGINLFYKSIELRKHCCQLRKLNPLKRALEGREAWFTGLRRAQSVTRVDMEIVEWDANSEMLKKKLTNSSGKKCNYISNNSCVRNEK